MLQAQVGDTEIIKCCLCFFVMLVFETQMIPMKTEMEEAYSF